MSTAIDPTQPAPPPAPRSAPAVIPPVRFERVPWRRVLAFSAIAYGLFALIASPFWFLPGGTGHPLFTPVIAVGMWAPAIASIIMAKAVEKTSWRTRVGLRWRGRWRGILLGSLLGPVLVLVIALLSVLIMAVRGVPVDLSAGYWLRELTAYYSSLAGTEVGAGTVVLITVVGLAVGLPVTLLATLGEEIGWRGWLWPALRPLGWLRAALVGGVIWSLWHLPIVLIGYNYAGQNRFAAVGVFTLLCCAMFLLFGALTDRAGGNPLPAAVAHAAFNSWGSLFLVLTAVPATTAALNPLLDTQAGITGIVLLAIAGALLMPWRARE